MGYPLYKETYRRRSCSLTPEQLDDVLSGDRNGIEVHVGAGEGSFHAEAGTLMRFVSKDEVIGKWYTGEIVGYVKERGKFYPETERRGRIVFYVVRW